MKLILNLHSINSLRFWENWPLIVDRYKVPKIPCPHPYDLREVHQPLDHTQKLHSKHQGEDQPAKKRKHVKALETHIQQKSKQNQHFSTKWGYLVRSRGKRPEIRIIVWQLTSPIKTFSIASAALFQNYRNQPKYSGRRRRHLQCSLLVKKHSAPCNLMVKIVRCIDTPITYNAL